MAVTVTKRRLISQPKIRFLFLPAILVTTISSEAYSGDWLFVPRINSTISYIDNVNLAPADIAESSSVLEISPGFRLDGEGRRLAANIDYSLQSLLYSNQPDTEEGDKFKTYHRLFSSVNSELVQRLLFFDASASFTQQSSSTLGKSSVDNYSLTEDRGTTSNYSLSPFVRHQIGNGLRSELRYRYNELHGEKGVVANSKINTFSLAMDSGKMLKKWLWTFKARSSDLSYESQSDQVHSSGDFGVSYRVSPRTTFSVHGGTEKVKYKPNLGETGGDYWSVAFEWEPGKRSSISMQAGERYYGQSYGLSIQHKTRHGIIGADYNEELTNQSFVLLESQADSQGSIPVLTNDVFLRKNFTAYVNWESSKSLITFRVSDTDDDFQKSIVSEKSQTLDVAWRLRLSKKMTFNVSSFYRHRKVLPISSKEILSQAEITLRRNIWAGANISASVVSINVDADNSLGYQQNRITLGVDMRW